MEVYSSTEPDAFWPYQVGTPHLIPSPPFDFEAVLSHEVPAEANDIVHRSFQLWKRVGLDIEAVTILWRKSCVPGSNRNLVLLVYSSWQDDDDTLIKWKRACTEARQFLAEIGLNNCEVHIVDPDRAESAFSFPPIAVDALIVGRWKSMRASIHECLRPGSWHTLSVLGQKPDDRMATILISAWNPRDEIWLGQKASIQRICKSYEIEADVVIMQALDVFFAGRKAGGQTRDLAEFKKLPMGSSLEIKGTEKSNVGTMGGLFLLQENQKTVRHVGLTCYHVVRAPRFVAAGKSIRK